MRLGHHPQATKEAIDRQTTKAFVKTDSRASKGRGELSQEIMIHRPWPPYLAHQ